MIIMIIEFFYKKENYARGTGLRAPLRCDESHGDVHGEEFLSEKFCAVRDTDVGEGGAVVAYAAFGDAESGVVGSHESAFFADVDDEWVGDVVGAFFSHEGGSVGHDALGFHFSEFESSVSGASFGGLSSEHDVGSGGAAVLFVGDHVFESLVVDGSDEDGSFEGFSGGSGVHDLVSVGFESKVLKPFSDGEGGEVFETGSVAKESESGEKVSDEGFFEMSDGHAGWDGMGVNDNVGSQSVGGVGHIFFGDDVSGGSFLSGSAAEFVSDDGVAEDAKSCACDVKSVSVFVDDVAVDPGFFGGGEDFTVVFEFDGVVWVVSVFDGDNFADDDVLSVGGETCVFGDESGVVEFVVDVFSEFEALGDAWVGFASYFFVSVDFLFVFVLFGFVEDDLEESAVDGALVEKDGVFLVVSGVSHDGDGDGASGGHAWELEEVEDACVDEGS